MCLSRLAFLALEAFKPSRVISRLYKKKKIKKKVCIIV